MQLQHKPTPTAVAIGMLESVPSGTPYSTFYRAVIILVWNVLAVHLKGATIREFLKARRWFWFIVFAIEDYGQSLLLHPLGRLICRYAGHRLVATSADGESGSEDIYCRRCGYGDTVYFS